jgi:hypothetical protein
MSNAVKKPKTKNARVSRYSNGRIIVQIANQNQLPLESAQNQTLQASFLANSAATATQKAINLQKTAKAQPGNPAAQQAAAKASQQAVQTIERAQSAVTGFRTRGFLIDLLSFLRFFGGGKHSRRTHKRTHKQ